MVNVISVITCTYNTPPDVLARTWASLKAQTFTDWEWVIYDDSPNLDTYNQVYGLCSDERYKIRVFRPHVPSGGNIGYAKHMAFSLGVGEILVELDHDDELTPDALAEIDVAFIDYGVGFVYSNCAEVFDDGTSGKYPEGWAFGYGSERWNEQHAVWEMIAPQLNRITLSHIVSVPNHVRCWRTSTYRELGGHDVKLPVADDYDLIVRSALHTTRCKHIDKLLYLQHIGADTAQRKQNRLIQDLVPLIHEGYVDGIAALYPQI
jgi:glycosyltransferase involved in cell wall biosynthesis